MWGKSKYKLHTYNKKRQVIPKWKTKIEILITNTWQNLWMAILDVIIYQIDGIVYGRTNPYGLFSLGSNSLTHSGDPSWACQKFWQCTHCDRVHQFEKQINIIIIKIKNDTNLLIYTKLVTRLSRIIIIVFLKVEQNTHFEILT